MQKSLLSLLESSHNGKSLEIKQVKCLHSQSSKQMNVNENHEEPPAEGSKVTPERCRGVAADWHCLDFNLA